METLRRPGERSDLAEVEEIGVGVDGEADPLEQALIADEVRTGPVGAQEDGGLQIEGLPLVSGKREGNPIESSMEQPEPCTQGDSPLNWSQSPPEDFS